MKIILLVCGVVSLSVISFAQPISTGHITNTTGLNLHKEGEVGLPPGAKLTPVDEKDIPEGAWVVMVEEGVDKVNKDDMSASDSIPFRPLFRYRAKQAQRRNAYARRRRYYLVHTPYSYPRPRGHQHFKAP